MRPSRLSILLVRSFYSFAIFISIGGGCVRRLGLSMKFGRYTAHRRIQHACGARQQDPSPICPTLSFGASSFGSGRPRGTFQLGVELRGSIGRLPLVSRAVTRENFVPHRQASGISVRILVRAPLGLIVVRDGRAVRTVPADDSTSQERAARAKDGNHA